MNNGKTRENQDKITCKRCGEKFISINGILHRTFNSGGYACYRLKCPYCDAIQKGFWTVVKDEWKGML